MRARILQMTLVSKDLEGMGCGGIGDDAEKFEMPLFSIPSSPPSIS